MRSCMAEELQSVQGGFLHYAVEYNVIGYDVNGNPIWQTEISFGTRDGGPIPLPNQCDTSHCAIYEWTPSGTVQMDVLSWP